MLLARASCRERGVVQRARTGCPATVTQLLLATTIRWEIESCHASRADAIHGLCRHLAPPVVFAAFASPPPGPRPHEWRGNLRWPEVSLARSDELTLQAHSPFHICACHIEQEAVDRFVRPVGSCRS